MLNTTESLLALYVKNTASGVSTASEIVLPNHIVHSPIRAMRYPELSKMKNTMNTSTDMITGTPSPPFLMIAPSGAPMKKNNRHCNATENLLMASILCCLINLSPSDVSIPLKSRSLISFLTLLMAAFTASSFLSADNRPYTESKLNVLVAAIFTARTESSRLIPRFE